VVVVAFRTAVVVVVAFRTVPEAGHIVVVAAAAAAALAAVDHTGVVACRTAAGQTVVAVALAADRTVHTAAEHRTGSHNFRFGSPRQPLPLGVELEFS